MSSTRRDLAVVVDVCALQNPLHRARGIGRYTIDHIDALLELGAPVAALLVDPTRSAEGVPQRWIDAGLVVANSPGAMRTVRAECERLVHHVASPAEPVAPDVLRGPHWSAAADCCSVTLFDLIPMRFPEWYQRKHADVSLHRRRGELVRTSDLVLTISEHTRREAIEVLGCEPRRVVTQGTGLSRSFDLTTTAPLPPAVTRPFVLTVPGWGEPRKDPTQTFVAWSRLTPAVRAAHQLVVVCGLPDSGPGQWEEQCCALGLAPDDVVFTGRVDDATLHSLYAQCAATVFVSLAEGFGLPALEAAALGAPVLVSDTTSLPEVLDEPAARVPYGDAEALAAALHRVLTDTAFADMLRRSGTRAREQHTWSAVAQRTLAAWTAQLPTATRPPSRAGAATAPCALGILGPMPPSKSGIGTFNARLVAALDALDTTVDVFSAGDDRRPPPPDGRHHRHFPVEAFGRVASSASYDAVVHTIGNAHYHREVLAHARATPGIVWLHEVFLAGLHLTEAGIFRPGFEPGPADIERARAAMYETTARVHGRPTTGIDDHNWWHTHVYDELGFSFTAELVGSARAVIVSTEAAATAIAPDVPPGTPVHVLPLPFPDRASTTRWSSTTIPESGVHESGVHESGGSDAGATGTGPATADAEPWIVTLGWVDPIKQPELLIEALARTRVHTPARLAFVGELAPPTRTALEAHAHRLGVVDAVTFTGFTTEAEYDAWLERARLVVQLRATSRGEASAALNDAVAAGRATITNIPTARELPGGVVEHLDADDPDALAALISELLTDHARRRALEQRAARHAATWTFDALARRLVEIVASLPPLPVG